MSCSGNCQNCAENGTCRPEEKGVQPKREDAMGKIRRKIVVMSGKGGVGKSTVSVQLARALALRGEKVGLLDVDLHGPTIPLLLGLEGVRMKGTAEAMLPVECGVLKVVSVGFLLAEPDAAVVWRGPMKMEVIRQLLQDVDWGELDTLVVDCPPGTGDEPLSVCQLLGDHAGAVLVTTPQSVATADVARSVRFCEQIRLPVWGIVENMSGFVCPHCGKVTEIFGSGGGKALADRYRVPFAGRLPLDVTVCAGGDSGAALTAGPGSEAVTAAMEEVVTSILWEANSIAPVTPVPPPANT